MKGMRILICWTTLNINHLDLTLHNPRLPKGSNHSLNSPRNISSSNCPTPSLATNQLLTIAVVGEFKFPTAPNESKQTTVTENVEHGLKITTVPVAVR